MQEGGGRDEGEKEALVEKKRAGRPGVVRYVIAGASAVLSFLSLSPLSLSPLTVAGHGHQILSQIALLPVVGLQA